MPIVEGDVDLRLSGGSANTNANASLGGAMSSEVIVDNILNNLWDNISGLESGSGDVEYRCIYVYNDHATLTMINTKVWIGAPTDSADDEIDIGLGTTAVGTGDEQLVANESTAPTSVTFSRPEDEAEALIIGDIAPGQRKAIWVRRTVNAGAAAATANLYPLEIECETLA